jgi:membrane associated rhomboid family serine protease
LIPLGTDRPNKRKALITPTLIGINLGVFILMLILTKVDPDAADRIGYYGAISRHHFAPWQPITSMFIHAGFMHIFGNMLFLMVFGPPVEDRLGRIGFTAFYFAGGIASGFAHIALESAPAVGASGAIAAVSGAFLILFPNTRIKCFVIFFIIGIFMIPSWWLIGLFVVLDLGAQVFTPANGIANMAHLGGYAFGIVTALTLLITGILPKEQYDMFSLAKHRKRRADFRVAHEMHKLAGVYQADQKLDPQAARIAELRAQIGSHISNADLPAAAELYLEMLKEFPDQSKALTLHRDAQYQLANHFYQSGNRQAAGDAFARLLDTYPNDPERHIITILLARIRAHDLSDPIGAIELLEDLDNKIIDQDTKALINTELETIRAIPQ